MLPPGGRNRQLIYPSCLEKRFFNSIFFFAANKQPPRAGAWVFRARQIVSIVVGGVWDFFCFLPNFDPSAVLPAPSRIA
jgi:hypothetical protein